MHHNITTLNWQTVIFEALASITALSVIVPVILTVRYTVQEPTSAVRVALVAGMAALSLLYTVGARLLTVKAERMVDLISLVFTCLYMWFVRITEAREVFYLGFFGTSSIFVYTVNLGHVEAAEVAKRSFLVRFIRLFPDSEKTTQVSVS